MNNFFAKYGWLSMGIGVFLIDRVTKELVIMSHKPHVWNTGGVWGIYQGGAWVLVSLAVFTAVVFYLVKGKLERIQKYALVLIAAGGLGNLVDRILYGAVVDWLHPVAWFPWFNLADVSINVGVLWLAIYAFYGRLR